MLSEKEIQKFTELNDKIRQEEICARKLYLELLPKLNEMVEDKLISDYEIDEELALFIFNKDFCKSKNIEVGDSFSSEKHTNFIQSDDDFFSTNWNEFNWTNSGQLKNLHFGYTMHCLLFHENLDIEDILAIDNFWLDLVVRYQFLVQT